MCLLSLCITVCYTMYMKSKTIKSTALEVLKSMISPQVKITDLEVRNKWLRATLSSGITFSVKNI